MSVQNTDLLLVQRGQVPYRATAEDLSTKIRADIDVSAPNKDIPVATISQLGVIRVGANLQIDANGVLDAVLPSGTSYEGVWADATTPPVATASVFAPIYFPQATSLGVSPTTITSDPST